MHLRQPIVMSLILAANLVCFSVSAEKQFGQQIYKRSNRTIELQRNLYAVSFAGEIKGKELQELFQKEGAVVSSVARIGHRRVVWYRSLTKSVIDLESRMIARKLIAHPAVSNTGGVFFESTALTLHSGRIWVYFPKGTNTEEVRTRLESSGARTMGFIKAAQLIALVSPPADRCVDDFLLRLQGAGFQAEPEMMRRYTPRGLPTDPYLEDQWYLNNDGRNVKHGGTGSIMTSLSFSDARVFGAWEHTMGLNEVRVAVIDSGVDCSHPEFIFKCEAGYDAFDEDDDPSPSDAIMYGHGTSVAGIATAPADGVGMVGVCPDCGLIPIRLIDYGRFTTDEMILRAYKHAVDSGAYVINISWGPSAPGDFEVPMTQGEVEGIKYAKTARGGLGTLVVFAAGNDNDDTARIGQLKSGEDHTIVVGATDHMDHRIGYSNFGDYLEISAPSVNAFYPPRFISLDRSGEGDFNGDYIKIFAGTSASAPIVSGVAGLIFSLDPDLSAGEVKNILLDTADKVEPDLGFWDEGGHSPKYGFGRVNAFRAALMALGLSDPICKLPTQEDCAVHLDEDCDHYVDEGCQGESAVGHACHEPSDCGEGTHWLCPSSGHVRDVCTIDCTSQPCPDGAVCRKGQCVLQCNDQNPCDSSAGLICNDKVLGECLSICELDTDCLEGEICNLETHLCHLETDGLPGSPCTSDECVGPGQFCLTPMIGFPGGYCTHMCTESIDCVNLSKCIETIHGSACYKACSMDGDCREGYLCMQAGPRLGTCYKPCATDVQCQTAEASGENVVCDLNTGRCVENEEDRADSETNADSEDETDSARKIEESSTDSSQSEELDRLVTQGGDETTGDCSCQMISGHSHSLISLLHKVLY